MTDKEYNARIDELVDTLHCSIAEAKEVLQADLDIDRNKKVEFGLSPEEEKKAIKLAHKGDKIKKKPTVYNFEKRERKPNETKRELIKYIAECFKEYENFEVTNIERQVKFTVGENDYELTLVQKRKPKK